MPFLIACKTFLESSNSLPDIIPASMAKFIHSSIFSGAPQYASQASLPPQAGGLMPLAMAACICLASFNCSGGINPFFSANEIHSDILSGLPQYVSHSACPLHPPGPTKPLSLNFLAISISSFGIKLFFSAKAKQASEFCGSSQYTLQVAWSLQFPNSFTGN